MNCEKNPQDFIIIIIIQALLHHHHKGCVLQVNFLELLQNYGISTIPYNSSSNILHFVTADKIITNVKLLRGMFTSFFVNNGTEH